MRQLVVILLLLMSGFAAGTAVADSHASSVPAPTFGLSSSDQIIASLGESATTNRYFVDNLHPSATDRDNRYGTPDHPRKTIPSGDLAGGTILTIARGTYEGPSIKWNVNGAANSPVLIRGRSEDSPPVIRQNIVLSGHYVIVEGLHFDRSRTSIRLEPGASHIAIRANRFVGPRQNAGNTSVLGVQGTADAITSNIVFANNEIRDFGDTQPGSRENDYHGIKASRYCSDIWIVDNRISNMGGDSVQIGDATLPDEARCSRIFITNNDFFSNRENAVDIKRANGVVIAENVIHDFLPPTSIDAPAIVVHDGADSVWILANAISNASSGIANTFGTNTWIIGNKIQHMQATPGSSAEDLYGNGTGVHLRGKSSGGVMLNIFDDYRHGIQIAGGSEYVVSGNLFSGSSQNSGYDLMIKSVGLVESSEFSQNLYKHFAARVGSAKATRKSQLLGSSPRDAQQLLELLDAKLCQNETVTLGQLDFAEATNVADRFTAYFGDDYSIQTVPMTLHEDDVRIWCGHN